MEIVSERRRVERVEYSRSFEWRDSPGAGFGFDCDESGEVDVAALNPAALENWIGCTTGAFDVADLGVETRRWTYTEHAVGRCCCGRKVELAHFTNTCACGRDYNSGGTLLAPRDQWGEETGEHIADILRIP